MCVPPPIGYTSPPLDTGENRHGELAKTIGGSFVSADIARSRWAEFEAQHKRWVECWKWRKAMETGTGTLLAEVDSLVENSFGTCSEPGVSHAGDITIRKPNCLGGVSLINEN
ncbi:hypothetical protein ES705_39366 [subsurface metagenome]